MAEFTPGSKEHLDSLKNNGHPHPDLGSDWFGGVKDQLILEQLADLGLRGIGWPRTVYA